MNRHGAGKQEQHHRTTPKKMDTAAEADDMLLPVNVFGFQLQSLHRREI